MKQTVITFLLTVIFFECFSQFRDTSILIKSEPIKIEFASKNNISTAFVTFLKFGDGKYGIQFNMVATYKTSANIYARNMDSLTLKLNDGKLIILKPFDDIVYNLMGGQNSWTAYYFVDNTEITLLKSHRIEQIFSGASLQVKKRNANKIYEIANSFL